MKPVRGMVGEFFREGRGTPCRRRPSGLGGGDRAWESCPPQQLRRQPAPSQDIAAWNACLVDAAREAGTPTMDAEPMNVLLIVSDEHGREFAGCYGNTVVRTPHIDGLASRGVVFESAYCNSPICVPSRACLATGNYVHRTGYWDSAKPYDGHTPSWHHRVRSAGHEVVAIGKLHYRSADDDYGFTETHLPMHVADGVGDVHGLLRTAKHRRRVARELAHEAGRGWSPYTRYDCRVADATVRWLRERGQQQHPRPWVLFCSMVSPHYPLIAPDRFYDLYSETDLPRPRLYGQADRPDHEVIAHYRETWNYDDYFDEERLLAALTAYYGLCSFLDYQIGRILGALKVGGFADDTLVIYTSDHGECLGNRGLWGKSVMFEESAGVPLVLAGPDIVAGSRRRTPVSHVDLHPTIVDTMCGTAGPDEQALPGSNLIALARNETPDRVVFSELHDDGSVTGTFMLRQGRWKLVHYVGHPPQLFDLAADPFETRDLAGNPDTEFVRNQLYRELRKIVDPEEIDRLAFADQKSRIASLGGAEGILSRPDFNFTPAPERDAG